MCTDLKEQLIRIWQQKAACIIPLVLTTMGAIPHKLLTPRSRVLVRKLTGSKLVKKFPAFYETGRLITAS
jgi:hypothetical protein